MCCLDAPVFERCWRSQKGGAGGPGAAPVPEMSAEELAARAECGELIAKVWVCWRGYPVGVLLSFFLSLQPFPCPESARSFSLVCCPIDVLAPGPTVVIVTVSSCGVLLQVPILGGFFFVRSAGCHRCCPTSRLRVRCTMQWHPSSWTPWYSHARWC